MSGWGWLALGLAGGGAWLAFFRRGAGDDPRLVYKGGGKEYQGGTVTIGGAQTATAGVARPVVPRSGEAVPGFTPGTRSTSDITDVGGGSSTVQDVSDDVQQILDDLRSARIRAQADAAGFGPDRQPPLVEE